MRNWWLEQKNHRYKAVEDGGKPLNLAAAVRSYSVALTFAVKPVPAQSMAYNGLQQFGPVIWIFWSFFLQWGQNRRLMRGKSLDEG